mmetsp:Transcript_74587/g.207296  ORF Transcript_74587/g.207296 Transcript_74587/m.207296 type:complete len:223 (+) Transcript_74587:81-749(+)|eukprot:CAMPEP_0117549332 /NCGR_PEP_ID=MMETSP0784-20121206/48111_1 /TAXON_ID=39447 /ORGANISM="" /LENGTH=222 /DNA_ID=CAMNT_0005346317 /DNA_START=88 /DNA_END=756 /DNA_ORIENTATION=+
MAALKDLFQRCTGIRPTDYPQFMILGLDKAGKTTLLYRLRLSSWPSMQRDMEALRTPDANGIVKDAGYHYEDITRALFPFGCWEIPGTTSMRHLWPNFYRAIKIHCVIFVVSVDEGDERIELATKNLHFLMNEDELRQACFCVIVNQRVVNGKKIYNTEDNEMFYRLGLHNLHPSCAWRTDYFVIDVLKIWSDAESEKEWRRLMEHARNVLKDERGYGLKGF